MVHEVSTAELELADLSYCLVSIDMMSARDRLNVHSF